MRPQSAVRFLLYAAACSMFVSCSSQPTPHPNPVAFDKEDHNLPAAPIASADSVDLSKESSPAPEIKISKPSDAIPDSTSSQTQTVPIPEKIESQKSAAPTQASKSAKTNSTAKSITDKTRSSTVLKKNEITVQQKQLTLSELARKYPEQLRLQGARNKKQAALTFDDAPDATFTPQVLDILKKYKIRATFFLVGGQVAKHPDIVRRIMKEGHVIGNHSYSHKLFTKINDESFQTELLQTQNAVKALTGYAPRLVRPPYGEIKESQLLWATSQGYLIVNWNVDSQDWKQLNEAQVFSNIVNHTRNGSIILQHSGGGPSQDLSGTVRALPQVIEKLQAQGYRLVTLPELLHVSKEK